MSSRRSDSSFPSENSQKGRRILGPTRQEAYRLSEFRLLLGKDIQCQGEQTLSWSRHNPIHFASPVGGGHALVELKVCHSVR